MWYKYTVEYYSAIKRNEYESVELRWVRLEPVIQSEVSQKEKNKYCILTHICIYLYQYPHHMESRKNDTDEALCRAGIEMQT